MCTGLCGRGSALPGPHLGMLAKTPQGSSTLLPSGPLPWILRKLSKAVFVAQTEACWADRPPDLPSGLFCSVSP